MIVIESAALTLLALVGVGLGLLLAQARRRNAHLATALDREREEKAQLAQELAAAQVRLQARQEAPASESTLAGKRLPAFQQDLISKPITPRQVRNALEGDSRAQLFLGQYLDALPATEADWTHALSRLLEAAPAGYRWAAEFLGGDPKVWADDGDWSPRFLMDSKPVLLLSSTWFHRAAEQGCCEAMHALSRLYAHGEGAQRDDVEALFWTILATAYREDASSGSQPSREALTLWKDLASRVSPGDYEISKVRALLWKHKLESKA